MNKNLRIGVIAILLVGIGFFVLTQKNSQPSAPVTNSETQPSPSVVNDKKITLIGTVKQLDNNSDPAQYSYELTLNFPFYDELESTGNQYVSKMPILSRDKVLQDSIKGYVGKEIAAEGLMAWGLGESRYLEVSAISDMSGWKTYTSKSYGNKSYGFIIKFPINYEVLPGNDSQNTCIRLNADSPCEVLINIYPNKDNLSLEDYLNKEATAFSIDGPLIPYNFNGYETLFNKNEPGTNLFIKRDLTVYRFIAPKASSDKEIGAIVSTFKFTQ